LGLPKSVNRKDIILSHSIVHSSVLYVARFVCATINTHKSTICLIREAGLYCIVFKYSTMFDVRMEVQYNNVAAGFHRKIFFFLSSNTAKNFSHFFLVPQFFLFFGLRSIISTSNNSPLLNYGFHCRIVGIQ
jgi:hypothetical protein